MAERTVLASIPVPAPQAIASYPASELASGTGQQLYYGAKDEDAYILTPNVIYSDRVMTIVTATSTSDTIQHDTDFDIVFNLPQRIRGEVIANIPFAIRNTSGAARSYNVYAKIYVRRVRATVESEIASDTGATVAWGGTTTANGAQERGMLCVSVTVPLTAFKVNDSLRITVELHGWSTTANTTEYCLGHDPKNRATDLQTTLLSGGNTFNTDPSVMTVIVPFVPSL